MPGAPDIKPAGYDVRSFLLDHSTMDRGDGVGHEQMRRRRFWFGCRDHAAPELRRFLGLRGLEMLDAETPPGPRECVHGGNDRTPGNRWKRQTVSGRHHGAIGVTGGHAGNPPRYSLDEMLDLQGLPRDVFEWSPLTMQGKRKFVGNAVPLPMAIQLAQAVREAMNEVRVEG